MPNVIEKIFKKLNKNTKILQMLIKAKKKKVKEKTEWKK